MEASKHFNLTTQILIAMALGVVLGSIIHWTLTDVAWINTYIIDGLFYIVKKIFVASLQMLVVPLVFVSLVCGVTALKEPSKLGKLSVKTIGLYLLTTALAISLALSAALLFAPGESAQVTAPQSFEVTAVPPVKDVLVNMVPKNPIKAMAEGNMLQIIIFAMLFGLAIVLCGEPGKRVTGVFNDLNAVIMRLVLLLMKFAPYGVFAIITQLFATLGFGAIKSLSSYFFLVLAILILHGLVVYPMLLKLFSGLNPFMFLRKMRAAQLFAFSTASSNATLPVTLRTVEKRLGVDNKVASFTLPLGATINMDGTAIMQGIATVFIAQVYGIDLSFVDLLTVVLMATMASIGAAGVPGVGLILLATVLTQVGLPVEGIALIIGIDRILDMARTAVNISGDAVVSCIVGKSEKAIDQKIYNDPSSGIINH